MRVDDVGLDQYGRTVELDRVWVRRNFLFRIFSGNCIFAGTYIFAESFNYAHAYYIALQPPAMDDDKVTSNVMLCRATISLKRLSKACIYHKLLMSAVLLQIKFRSRDSTFGLVRVRVRVFTI